MDQTSVVTDLRADSGLTDADRDAMGVDGQVMLVTTTVYVDELGESTTQSSIGFHNTVDEANQAASELEQGAL